jgi:hypothetical protein
MNSKKTQVCEGRTSFEDWIINSKKGQVLGEGIMMMYRIFLVSLVALIILGISSIFYSHSIDVRDAEAIIMTRNLVECISSGGLDLGKIESQKLGIMSECGYEDAEIKRFYVRINLDGEKNDYIFSQGDSGAKWVLEIFKYSGRVEKIKQYKPGYYTFQFPLKYNNDEYDVKVEVLSSNES